MSYRRREDHDILDKRMMRSKLLARKDADAAQHKPAQNVTRKAKEKSVFFL